MTEHRSPSGWVVGGALFAGSLMIMIGIFDMLSGLAGIFRDDFYVSTSHNLYKFDATAWGWAHLIIGAVIAFAGYGVLTGATWARIVGVILAMVAAVENFMFIPYYPFWSIVIIALCVWVIWVLAFHGEELRSAAR